MKNKDERIKEMVKEKYSEIAEQSLEENLTSCCGAGGCGPSDYTIMSDDYTKVDGYNTDADLGLGCGIPTEFAQIKEGDTVVDLGSGAGNDVFVARQLAGTNGKVIGIDMTQTMIDKARANNEKLGYNNIEFRLGEIENMPIGGNSTDVVISNCVLNLVPNKANAFKEIYRILKPWAHFSISDIVIVGNLPEAIKKASEMYAGCVAGAIQKQYYLNMLSATGFINIKVQKEKTINIPDEILRKYLSESELKNFKESETGIYSITVFGQKPEGDECCRQDCC